MALVPVGPENSEKRVKALPDKREKIRVFHVELFQRRQRFFSHASTHVNAAVDVCADNQTHAVHNLTIDYKRINQ